MDWAKTKEQIEAVYDNKELLKGADSEEIQHNIRKVIHAVDSGNLRVAEAIEGKVVVHDWVKKAILLFFPISELQNMSGTPFAFQDKIPLKTLEQLSGVRVVPGAVARFGAHISKGSVLMPSFVNIGAFVDEGTMVDTWATVGSCAQIGKRVHLSGGVGIGGVLEPPQAAPVVIEDGAFVGSRCIVVEGVHVGAGAVLGANVVLTASTRIIDVSSTEAKEYKGYVPANSVVIPGSRTKTFPAGDFQVPAALIVGQRKASTDEKTSLNDALRDFDVSV